MAEEKQVPEVETQEDQTQETVLKDEKDPLDTLKEVVTQSAKELGLNEDEIKLMTTKEIQSYADKVVTQAIKTREERLLKQQEEEKLIQEKKFKELLKMKEEELSKLKLESDTLELLTSKGKGKEWSKFLTAPTIEGRKEQLETVEKILAQEIQNKISNIEKSTFKPEEKKPVKFDNAEDALKTIFQQQK